MKFSTLVFIVVLFSSCHTVPKKEDHQIIEVLKTNKPYIIDGKGSESFWNHCSWYNIDQNWKGKSYSHEDFHGRYKISWSNNELLLLVEITDDTLYSPYKEPFKLWWNNDSLQIFIDEDNSGGLHQYNHNAFAYNLALNNNTLDVNTRKKPQLYNEHITYQRITKNTLSTWEISIKVHKEGFDSIQNYSIEELSKNKKIGFALAYSDNDRSTERENFIGSVYIPGEDKNQAWINADIFGTLILKE
ncbi:sugar-binding protein [uncultured Maribacter sp.]|uniref:sugar-binding protein n=1 Tax=uncultured Maribacter sp. TaxID=431308 RepID=UPI0026231078|nr:sugar-binding protein [uncultured Maribacter sp.]